MSDNLVPHTKPLEDALKAYGIDLENTPTAALIEQTKYGIIIDQYLPTVNVNGDPTLTFHQDGEGKATAPVMARKFFHHPLVKDNAYDHVHVTFED